ncbi:hypothetical protein FGG90_11700 [Clavibacter tessellarius]|uniref:DUF2975 domain-containing protein n=1 Tax=Clavibacter tessellarius TaxID=31965 RepID=A0A225CCF7_9MICO|nr:hypothetical protein [Clavibacter michiganensis]OQJ62411.1 hypothetical protein B5P24_05020 [Clavibacter michiganensis subsp. tessellarius]UKF34594.1 hypothetical protein FGG90_11700 [Clavibacter michiganensis subsp. tessellarius]
MSSTSTAGPAVAAQSTRLVLRLAFVVALLVMLAVAVSAALVAVETIRTGVVRTSLEMRGDLPARADAGSADLRSGAYRTADVAVGELSDGIVAMHVVRIALDASVGLALAGTVAILARRLLRPDPLARRVSLVVTLAGGTVMIAALLSLAVGTGVAWLVGGELNDPLDGLEGFWPVVAEVDLSTIALGFALMIVGLVVEHGERLQRDTRGLV